MILTEQNLKQLIREAMEIEITPESFAEQYGLEVEYSADGEKIIRVDIDDLGKLKNVPWDLEQTDTNDVYIYHTGEYVR